MPAYIRVYTGTVNFEKAKLTNRSTNEPEILHVNRFSSELVHRLIYLLIKIADYGSFTVVRLNSFHTSQEHSLLFHCVCAATVPM